GRSHGLAIATSINGGIVAAGDFSYEVDFDPGAGTYLINTGETLIYADAFVLSLEGLAPASGAPEVFAVTALGPSPTNAASVQYSVTFSEPVNGVNASDFALTTVGITGASVTAVSGSADSYTVTVATGSGDGTIRLDVIDNDSITATDDGTPLGGTGAGNGNFTSGEVYTVDKTAPTASIGAPSVTTTANGPVTYTVTYSGASGVTLDAGDVTLNASGNATGDIAVTGSGNVSRTVVISNITGNGTLGISIAAGTATDLAGNSASGAGPSVTFTVNNLAIAVNIGPPSLSQTNIGPVSYVVAYDNASSVTLDPADVTLNATGNANASIGVGPVTKTLYRQVTLSNITGNGTLGISIAAGTATDGSGNSAPAAGPSATFTVDNTNPDVDSIVLSPAKATQCYYIVTFTEPVTNVDTADFALTTTGTVTGAFVASVGGSGAVRIVGVFSGSGDGTIRLDLADNDTIRDAAGNPLGGPGVGNGDFTSGDVYNSTGGESVPLDWRWSLVALLVIGVAALARAWKAAEKV
ncbi:MAG: hypothetical protein IT364_26020, partial [Candidatus Hydrogenedentes bacterium]|nr:hypothetical protein [Candidatus Hydrogenedentota bacterium]